MFIILSSATKCNQFWIIWSNLYIEVNEIKKGEKWKKNIMKSWENVLS